MNERSFIVNPAEAAISLRKSYALGACAHSQRIATSTPRYAESFGTRRSATSLP